MPFILPIPHIEWTVLATTVSAEACTDAEVLQAYQQQHTTVEPGFRWIKNPAAISPVWLEKPERIAALAMLRLELLTAAEVEAYVAQRLGVTPVTAHLGVLIHRRTDGNALFMVHVLDYLLEHGLLLQAGGSGACATTCARWTGSCPTACRR